MISEDTMTILREMYGDHADEAASKILYWLQHGYLPVITVFIQAINYAPDGSLIYVHKDWSD
jgi:hypothetical protein